MNTSAFNFQVNHRSVRNPADLFHYGSDSISLDNDAKLPSILLKFSVSQTGGNETRSRKNI